MERIVLFGAGQVGAMAAAALAGGCELVCFADNSPQKQGSVLFGAPVCSPERSLEAEPDNICICVTDSERRDEMTRQLRALGYAGRISDLSSLRVFDPRAAAMRLLARELEELGIEGAAAELGVYRGEFAALMNAALPGRELHLFDTFEGFDRADIVGERGLSGAAEGDFSDTSVEAVLSALPHPERAVIHKGRFPDSFDTCSELCFALVSLDADLYAPTAAALPLFYDRLSPGGAIILHDVNSAQFPGAGRALREFCRERGVFAVPLSDFHGSAVLRRQKNA